MPFSLSRFILPTRLVSVLVVGLFAAGLPSPSAQAENTTPGRVGGLVLDRANQPVPGATISLAHLPGTVAGAAKTDDQGRWTLTVPQGDYELHVSVGQGDDTSWAKVARYSVGAGTKLNLILAGDPDEARRRTSARDPGVSAQGQASPVFTRAAATAMTESSSGSVTFSGWVVDADGDPVGSGVRIWLLSPSRYPITEEMVSEDGTFSLGVPAGVYSLRVETGAIEEDDCGGSCGDYGRGEQRAHSYYVDNFSLDGDRQETIRLPRPEVVTITVVDPSNRPVVGAWVSYESSGWGQPPIPTELFPGASPTVDTFVDLRTGNDGTAEIEVISGSGPATVSVDPPPGTQLPIETPFPANATSLKIQVQDGPTLHGRLRQADGAPLLVYDAYLDGEGGPYYFAVNDGQYAVTAPPGRYRMYMSVEHNEDGESSDYWIWRLGSDEFEISGDRVLDLDVPLGKARLWVVDDRGERLEKFYTYGFKTSSYVTIADGIRATTRTNSEAWPDEEEYLAVIGPSHTERLSELEDYAGAPDSAYVAPGEHTIIAFIAGTGPGYDPLPPTTTTTTGPDNTAPPTTNTTIQSPTVNPGINTAGNTSLSGYWALGSDGRVYSFGDAAPYGNATTGAIDLEPTPSGKGYWTLNKNGLVQAFGDATNLGAMQMSKLAKGETPASLSATPSGNGYWVFTNRGRAIAFGDAPFLGDVSTLKLNGPVLGSVGTPTGKGYYMVASDGGIFAFGDAAFGGSMGGTKLNAPVQSLVPDSDGTGYWLVASDGGIFAFDAPFKGSLGGVTLNKPVVGMVRYGDGYLMVGADGGIFNFSSSPFAGSLGDKPPASPVVAVAAIP